MILTCIIASVGLSVAQTTRVSGKVVDDTGETVIGASVVAKGTTVGTVTDLDGNFSLNIPSDRKTLVISLIGMKTKEVAAGTNLNIVLENDSKLMSEVVVTAMGITRSEKALGYATQDVKASELIQAGNSSLSGALQGKVAGVQITPSSGMPGASSKIVIRGARSFTGNNTPLYIIDGMPVASTSDQDTGDSVTGTDFANRGVDIDPNDIESVNILKGQAASALYGIRASNGVVIITTKNGRGMQKGKAQISFTSNVSFEKLSTYPEMQNQYAQGSGGKFNPTSSMSWGPKISDLPNDAKYGGNVANELNGGDTQKYQGKYYVQQRANAGLDPWVTPQAYDNVKEFFNTGATFNNALNIMQATDKTTYSYSLGSTTQSGIIPETGMHRYNSKLAAETKLNDQWTAGFVGNYVYTKIYKQPSANDALLATVFGSPASYDLAGIPAHYEGNPYKQNNYRTGAFPAAYWSLDNNKFTETTSRFFGNAYGSYSTKLNSTDKKMLVKYQLGTDSYTTNYVDSWGYGNKGTSNNGQIEEYSWNVLTLNSLLTANFDWTIDQDWTLNAVLGNEFIQDKTKYNYSFGKDFNFPGWNHIQNATVSNNQERSRRKRNVGFFGSASASYKNMLYMTVTGRNDVVSNMPRNNRSFFYPSISTSFVLSELEGFDKTSFLNFAKIRLAYAEVGQAGDYYQNYFYKPSYDGGFYDSAPIMYPINNPNNGGTVSGFVPYYKIYDPNLKPQNTKSYEVGFDSNFLDNIFTLSYTFSRQNVTDQIFEIPLAGSTGASSMITNGGRIHTNVHEITLGVNPVKTKDIDWNFAFNWTKIDNYVDELAPGVESIMLGGFVTPQVRAEKGSKFPVIYGVSYKRDDFGNIIVDENGIPMAGDTKVIGKAAPDFLLGFNTSIRIHKFNVVAVLDWKSGGQMYSGTNGLMDLYGRSKNTDNRDEKIIADGVKEDKSRNDIPVSKQDYYQGISSIDESYIYNSSFIKLRELAVNRVVFKSSAIEVSANIFARNILLWSELPNMDPESSQGNNNMAGAFERFSLPQTSSYGLGLNVKF